MPPVGPGVSLTTMPFFSVVCSVMPARPGGTVFASAGVSAALPQNPPTQIGKSGSPRSNSTHTPAPIGGTVNRPMLMPATGMQGIAQLEGEQPGDVGHHRLDAADLQRVDVVDHRAAILAEEGTCAHTGTVGRVEINPLRASENVCLYSPRLMSCVTLLT